MVRSVSGTVGIRKQSETPAELIQDYVDFLNSQPVVQGSGTPASVGFQMTQHVPAEYGPGAADKKPEVIYSWGVLHRVGTHSLGGWGTRQSSNSGFAHATDGVYVQLDQPDSLNASGASPMKLTLHHDVLIGSTIGPTESTSAGSVATVMLWAIPASLVR
jgi:hypothetical protein